MAKLRFYYGTMGGAKSLRLLTTAYNFQEKNLNFIVLKPACDTRDGNDVISSRIGLKRPCLALYPQDSVHLIVENYKNLNNNQLNWLLLDEAQFLTEKQVDELANIVDTLNVDVMCFG